MKKGMLMMSILVSSIFGLQSYAQQLIEGPAISVDKETHNYGNIAYEANGECVFTVTNNGTQELIITGARGSCGCTVPTYPKDPILPGASATIRVTYDTKRSGDFKKSVTITSNAVNEPSKTVYIQGTVAAKPEGTAPVAPSTGPTATPSTTTPGAPSATRPGNTTAAKPSNGSATVTTPK